MLHLLCCIITCACTCPTSLYCFLQYSLFDCTKSVIVPVAVELTRKLNHFVGVVVIIIIIIIIINLENAYLQYVWSITSVHFMRYISGACLI
jgi:hypothetical protein